MEYKVYVYTKGDSSYYESYGPFDTECEAMDEKVNQEAEWEDDPDFDRVEIEEIEE